MDYKDIVVRAVKTFGQAFVAFIVASGIGIGQVTHISELEKVALAAAVAGASAVWNVVLVPLWQPVKAKLGL